MQIRSIPIDLIRADAKAQPRQHISTDVVAAYSDDMATGATFPPLVVFKEGNVFWLADGFHRLAAFRGVVAKVSCEVHEGGLRDAILHSCGANAEHGHRRTNEDKRRAVHKLLADGEWSHWSDHEIARRAHVTHVFVGKLRAESHASLETVSSEPPRTFVNKHGSTSKMGTAAIGPRKMGVAEGSDTLEKGDAEPVRHDENTKLTEAGWMVPILNETVDMVRRLPPPKDAAQAFPNRMRKAFDIDGLRIAAAWLTDFAAAWDERA